MIAANKKVKAENEKWMKVMLVCQLTKRYEYFNYYHRLQQGVNFFFFSDNHLAPKFFKVVANSKKIWSPFSKTNQTFFYVVSVLDRSPKTKLGKGSLTCYKVDTRINDIQPSGSPKSKMVYSY